MSRHITDQDRDRSGNARLRAFTQHDREGGTHPAIEALRRRPREREDDNGRKVAEFARAARETE